MNYNAVLDVKIDEGNTPTEPLTLNEAKEWCKIELAIAEEDALITELIKTARLQVEGFLNISLVDKTIEAAINNSLGGIELPYGPLKTFTSLKDEDGNILSVDTDYKLQGVFFKSIKTPCSSFLIANYTTGYTSANPLPMNFKTAVLQQVAYLYENRGDTPANATTQNNRTVPTELSQIVELTLSPYRRVW
jgi:uncharacterized phiE125 gp8 family phage protein